MPALNLRISVPDHQEGPDLGPGDLLGPRALDWRSRLRCLALGETCLIPLSDLLLTGVCLLATGVEALVLSDPRPAGLALLAVHLLIALLQPLRHVRQRTCLVLTYAGLALSALLAWAGPVGLLGLSPLVVTAATGLHTITRWDPDHRWAVGALLLAVAGSVANPALLARLDSPALARDMAWLLPLTVACAVAVVATYLQAASRRAALEQRQQGLCWLAAQATVAERLDLAREAHNVIGHRLTAIRLQAASGSMMTDPERLRTAMSTIQDVADTTLVSVHEVVALLQADRSPVPGRYAPTGDVTVVPDLLSHWGAQPDDTPSGAAVPDAATLATWNTTWTLLQRLALVRVLNEALADASRGSTPRVSLCVRDGWCRLSVTEALPPRRRSEERGTGLVGLGERLRMAGGFFETGPVELPDGTPGSRLSLAFPVAG